MSNTTSNQNEAAVANGPYTIEPHGLSGYAIYRGRDINHHGENLGHLSECMPYLPQEIEEALNRGASTTQDACGQASKAPITSNLAKLLKEWSHDFEAAAEFVPTRLQAVILKTRALECLEQVSLLEGSQEAVNEGNLNLPSKGSPASSSRECSMSSGNHFWASHSHTKGLECINCGIEKPEDEDS